jgi:bifunctional UDP-N-acetylglucosamine pyrophosphorylase / glucosamine-1-phosphate N-acetyltransferase
MMVIDAEWAQAALHRLSASKVSGEFYLTDLIALAVEDGPKDNADWPVAAVRAAPEVAMGVDEPGQLARADAVIRDRIRARHLESGVQMIGADTIFIDEDVDIGAGTTISPFTIIRNGSSIGQRCVIGPNAVLERAKIGDDVIVQSSTLTDVSVASGSDVGPYSHLRGQSEIGPNVHIGNFVEINRSVVEERVKVGHVSYLGDAHVGADTNIGAGAITCNFDGKNKHRTVVGRSVFIGSDTMLVAPVTIGDGAVTGAGSVVTRDVAPGVTVMGVPARPRPAVEASESGKEERNG